MHDARKPSLFLRLLAPVALVAAAVALAAVLLGSGVLTEEADDRDPAAKQDRTAAGDQAARRRAAARERARRRERQLPQDVYTVKTGDTLGSIAEETGVPVERLQELNPEVDPQALVSGQKIKLRE